MEGCYGVKEDVCTRVDPIQVRNILQGYAMWQGDNPKYEDYLRLYVQYSVPSPYSRRVR